MWKLSIERVDLSLLKPQYALSQNSETSIHYYSFFAYLLWQG